MSCNAASKRHGTAASNHCQGCAPCMPAPSRHHGVPAPCVLELDEGEGGRPRRDLDVHSPDAPILRPTTTKGIRTHCCSDHGRRVTPSSPGGSTHLLKAVHQIALAHVVGQVAHVDDTGAPHRGTLHKTSQKKLVPPSEGAKQQGAISSYHSVLPVLQGLCACHQRSLC